MNIVVDENIPFGREIFSSLGKVQLAPGRMIHPDLILDAEILVVRSITKVDEALLQGSRVQFVGTATAGTDHVDQVYLKSNNILFASAGGANADSVVEYVITALLLRAQKKATPLKGASLGIVGVGHIGTRLASRAKALGMEVVLNDPPRARLSDLTDYRSLSEVCACDFISLHVPLSYEGCDATFQLFDGKVLSALSPRCVLINSARGEVVDNTALLRGINSGSLAAPILDVWENEPDINWDLLSRVEIGTPHIAGYAIDGKIQGTLMIYEALCAALGTDPSFDVQSLSLPRRSLIQIDGAKRGDIDVVSDCCTQVYDLAGDHMRLLSLLRLAIGGRPAAFDRLRKTYPSRRVFRSMAVSLKNGSAFVNEALSALGFHLDIPQEHSKMK